MKTNRHPPIAPFRRPARRLTCLAALMLCAAPVLTTAQPTPPTPPAAPPPSAGSTAPPRTALPPLPPLPPLDEVMRVAESALSGAARALELDRAPAPSAGERVVKGAPYCADAVHETVQWLADGGGGAPNRIVRQQTTRLCRDGEGRTRQEAERHGRRVVYLRDPVARESWTLDTERRTARRGGDRWPGDRGPSAGLSEGSAWREYAEQMREWAREMAERARAATGHRPAPGAGSGAVAAAPGVSPTPPTPPVPAVITRGDGAVQVLRFDGPPGAGFDAPPTPPTVQWRTQVLAPRGPGVVTALPAREIEGLRVHGERTTWTIEAGRIGNERPIEIVREVWISPDLMLTVATRDFDPRSGEVNYRLTNLRRGEPDPALLKVPADYARGEGGAERAAPRASAPRG